MQVGCCQLALDVVAHFSMEKKNKVLLFNPRSAERKYRVPNSVLQIAASIDHQRDWVIVDGNREENPWQRMKAFLDTGDFAFVGFTVMPGPQLKQAIPFTKTIRQEYPDIWMIWGGYFASNQHRTVLDSGLVDFVINGPGDVAFPRLLEALENGARASDEEIHNIRNLIFKSNGELVKTAKEDLLDYDKLPRLPYDKLNEQYSMEQYLGKTYLGNKTLAYHSSFGCPFTCSFCAVVPIYQARWKGMSAEHIYRDVKMVKDKWGADAIEFHDNNFFVSEKRTKAFSEMIAPENMVWWGEGRIDTIDRYSDETLALMRDAGCKMIFFGAETGNDEVLKKMDKGGTQSAAQILEFAARMKQFDIVPEYSFVLGCPADTPEEVMKQIDEDIAFIRKVKEVNPDTEIIIYLYSPVPTEGSDMYEAVLAAGFQFPKHLEDWLNPEWENFDLRKNPLTPWLTPAMVDKIMHFETVLNAAYPTVSDIRLGASKRKLISNLAKWRYRNEQYKYPYELKVLQKLWNYRQPEIQGF